MAASNRMASSIVPGSLGSIARARIVKASSWLMMCIKPNCNNEKKKLAMIILFKLNKNLL